MLYKTINISLELHKALRLRAAETGLTILELIEDACSVYLNPDKKEYIAMAKEIKLEDLTPKPHTPIKPLKSATFKLCKHGNMPKLCKHQECRK